MDYYDDHTNQSAWIKLTKDRVVPIFSPPLNRTNRGREQASDCERITSISIANRCDFSDHFNYKNNNISFSSSQHELVSIHTYINVHCNFNLAHFYNFTIVFY